jgi:non-canonical (house-cleaning) NTP pyrophosphatase
LSLWFRGLVIMAGPGGHLREFWSRFQSGVEVAVDSAGSDRLLGVRDGFRRYFHDGLEPPVPVAVVPHPEEEGFLGLAVSDEETLGRARRRARRLQERLGTTYHFYVSTEGGLHSIELAGETRYFVRNWTVIVGAAGEGWGGSGSVQLPERLVAGLTSSEIGLAVPGTRRSGGMIHSLTGGLETRRSAVGLATFHALSTLFYGILESRPLRPR